MSDSEADITLSSSQILQAILSYIGELKAQQDVNKKLAHHTIVRAVKWASPNGFGLALAGFGLNGPGQKTLV